VAGTGRSQPRKHKYDGLGFATLAFNDMSGIGRGGTGTLTIDGKVVAIPTIRGPNHEKGDHPGGVGDLWRT
jgi:hypothetical protein